VAKWLQKVQMTTEQGIYWPGRISWEEEVSGKVDRRGFRDAWCYGAPGIARSLYLAGDALKNEALKKQALLIMHSVFTRTPKEWGLISPTVCHGQGGLLLIAYLMAKDTQDAQLQKNVENLEKQLWDFYRPKSVFGFQDFENHKEGVSSIDKAGFLEGATGVILTLLTVRGSSSPWHYPLLLSKGNSDL
jgi:lantibiotic modifying enzyme